MDLALLSRQATRCREQDVARVQRHCDTGYYRLAQAVENPQRQSERLEQAMEAFLKALHLRPSSTPAYIGMGYLLLILGEIEQPQDYLGEALLLAPNDPDACNLWAAAEKALASGQLMSATESLVTAGAELDYDSLYETLLTQIKSHSQRWLQQPPPLEPSLDPLTNQSCLEQRDQLQQWLSQTHTQLQVLSQEIESQALFQQLNPLERLLSRYEDICRWSERFCLCAEAIQSQRDALRQRFQAFHAQPELADEAFQAGLDALYDACDRIADELEHFENQGLPIVDLLGRYEAWVAEVEAYSQLVEERD